MQWIHTEPLYISPFPIEKWPNKLRIPTDLAISLQLSVIWIKAANSWQEWQKKTSPITLPSLLHALLRRGPPLSHRYNAIAKNLAYVRLVKLHYGIKLTIPRGGLDLPTTEGGERTVSKGASLVNLEPKSDIRNSNANHEPVQASSHSKGSPPFKTIWPLSEPSLQ